MASFQAYLVSRDPSGAITRALLARPLADLGSAGVLVRVHYSSLNYKDALAATGHPGIVKAWPHVPGIDAAGTLADDPGQPVLLTGFGLGTEVWGGFGDYVRVPHDWVLPLPAGLTMAESMVLGTAGLTAALAVDALITADIRPDRGTVLVTGATGGVGSLSVLLLSQLGFAVVAATRQPEQAPYLKALGAQEVVIAEDHDDGKALHTPRWQAAIDTVGGRVLTWVVKGIAYGGAVAACGMAGGGEWQATVFPFILRGVRLFGIDSVWCPRSRRAALWQRLAGPWRPRNFEILQTVITRAELDRAIANLLQGRHTGRTLVRVREAD